MLTWLKELPNKVWLWLVGLGVVVTIYLLGRRTRKGEVNLEVALHELERVNRKAAGVEDKLAELRKKQVDISADILEAQVVANDPDYSTLSDSDIDERLRKRGLIK